MLKLEIFKRKIRQIIIIIIIIVAVVVVVVADNNIAKWYLFFDTLCTYQFISNSLKHLYISVGYSVPQG